MKNDLSCGVVRDLLPSYVENLLGEESREAVERHLETCPACTAEKEAMTVPPEAEAAETEKEVDFLKRVKKGTAKKITLAVVCTALVLAAALGLKVFVIGTPLQPQSVMAAAIQEDEDGLRVNIISAGSGNAFHGWKVETVNGVASIYARDVLISPLFHEGTATVYVPTKGVKEIWLGGTSGQLLWAGGLVISDSTWRLYQVQTPYVGDAPALGRIAELLNISQVLGPYTTSLHTAERPYVWTLEFQEEFDKEDWRALHYYAYQMLVLVENLDKVAYRYEPSDAHGRTMEERTREGSVSAESASRLLAVLTEKYNALHQTDWPIHESIKEYAESPLEYQRMVTLLKEHFLSQW